MTAADAPRITIDKLQAAQNLAGVFAVQNLQLGKTKAGKPYLDLKPHLPPGKDRVPGRYKGKIRMAPDFDELPEDMLAEFEGEE